MKKSITLILVIALGIVSGRLAYLGAGKISFFQLNEIRIKGESGLDERLVIAASGLRLGESVFEQDLKRAAANIITIPGVHQATILRRFPGSVEINIQTEKPSLLAKMNRLYGVTGTQKIIALQEPDLNLPIVTGLKSHDVDEFESNQPKSREDRLKLSYAVSIYDQIKSISPLLAERIAEINVSNFSASQIFLEPQGIKVIIGLNDWERSIQRLSLLENSNLLAEPGIIDMRGGRVISKIGETNG